MKLTTLLKTAILSLSMLCSLETYADTYRYYTTAFTYAEAPSEYWEPWVYSELYVDIDSDDNLIVIHSSYLQVYNLIESSGERYAGDNRYIEFNFINQDGDRGTLRIVKSSQGTMELYIEYSNIKWCYRIKRLK